MKSVEEESLTNHNSASSVVGTLAPVFFAKSPLSIKYQKKSQEIVELPVEEFAKQIGFTWADSLYISRSEREKIWSNTKMHPHRPVAEPIEHRLHYPLHCFVIREMDERVGVGVFLDLKANYLPRGTIIAIYAGEIKTQTSSMDASYVAYTTSEVDLVWSFYGYNPIPVVDARQFGNISRFIQDMPDDEELNNSSISTEQADRVATANLIRPCTTHYGWPYSFLMTLRDISPGEQLGFRYVVEDKSSNSYWKSCSGGVRYVFNMDGVIIGEFNNNKLHLNSELAIDQMPKAKRVKQTHEDIINFSKKTNTFDYQISFRTNIAYVLDIYVKKYPPGSEEAKLVACLKDSEKGPNSNVKLYSEIKLLIKNSTFEKKTLQALKTELLFHMGRFAKYYQADNAKRNSTGEASKVQLNRIK